MPLVIHRSGAELGGHELSTCMAVPADILGYLRLTRQRLELPQDCISEDLGSGSL